MNGFATMHLPHEPTTVAPDGSDVRVLLGLPGGGMAHFRLEAGAVAQAVAHRTVEEVWFVVAGRGQMWRRQGEREETVALEPGVCLTIPLGTHFQFRASADEAVAAVAITMPPWPGDGEAYAVTGPWTPTHGNALPPSAAPSSD
jgi:mannose-6-phosphate isomerase-like protein (cupin superfamily)